MGEYNPHANHLHLPDTNRGSKPDVCHNSFPVVSAENAFSFNASYYTQEELEKKTHNYELTESDSVVFCVDYALNGIGSNSCGPVVLEQYRFDDVLFRFQFTLIPYVKG